MVYNEAVKNETEMKRMDLNRTAIGIELGSTRIKAVLIDDKHLPVASGSYEWENQLVDGIWTYSMDMVTEGVQTCFKRLKQDTFDKTGVKLTKTGAIGISAMMHGYLVFDEDWKLLVPFRTWRNTITGEASEKLSKALDFNIPQRWSVAHLYQAKLNNEAHVKDVAHLTTLAGYLHYLLTGKNAVGIGEASGMFPIDSAKVCFDEERVSIFDELSGFDIVRLLPEILLAGQNAGTLTPEGARFLDPTGEFEAGVPLAPCEGDAGTGMVATNSVRVRTGNVSAGTSAFAMIVTDKKMAAHENIDMVTTPAGLPVAMVHCNNCTSDINAWVKLLDEFASALGVKADIGDIYTLLFNKALEGEKDAGGIVDFNCLSGEHMLGLTEGRPLITRTADAKLSLSNFMRAQLMSALAVIKIGLDMLKEKENIEIDSLTAHGGYFKTPGVGQRLLSAAAGSPVSVLETAGEGGPYGMALLAAYMLWKGEGERLEDYLDGKVFAGAKKVTLSADREDVEGFEAYIASYKRAVPVEAAAAERVLR